jgi:hypothetical protein
VPALGVLVLRKRCPLCKRGVSWWRVLGWILQNTSYRCGGCTRELAPRLGGRYLVLALAPLIAFIPLENAILGTYLRKQAVDYLPTSSWFVQSMILLLLCTLAAWALVYVAVPFGRFPPHSGGQK